MQVDIELSRPFSLLAIVGMAFVSLTLLTEGSSQKATLLGTETEQVDAARGGEDPPALAIHTAEDEIRRARLEQELAERHIAVLKYQLKKLEAERSLMQPDLTADLNEEFRAALRNLVELIEGKRRADSRMVESFKQMWDARQLARAAAQLGEEDPLINLTWPLDPLYGISAIFKDPEYAQFFGIEHDEVDIPALQGTPVLAADDGVIESVVDNGLGYSYLVIRHDGYATLYGHMSRFDVVEGQEVLQGDPIGLSGGMPGTKGAGNLSTGPHLHFELITGRGHINPLTHLPAAGVKLRETAL